MCFHIEPSHALVVLELAAGCSKSIAQREVGVFMSLIGSMRAPDCDLHIGQRDVDVEVVQPALVLSGEGV